MLSLEEAFFMHHALQALTVSDDKKVLRKQVILPSDCHVTKRTWHKSPMVSAAHILAERTGLWVHAGALGEVQRS